MRSDRSTMREFTVASCCVVEVMPVTVEIPAQPTKQVVADTLLTLASANSPERTPRGGRTSPPVRRIIPLGGAGSFCALELLVTTVTPVALMWGRMASAVELVLMKSSSLSSTSAAAAWAMAFFSRSKSSPVAPDSALSRNTASPYLLPTMPCSSSEVRSLLMVRGEVPSRSARSATLARPSWERMLTMSCLRRSTNGLHLFSPMFPPRSCGRPLRPATSGRIALPMQS